VPETSDLTPKQKPVGIRRIWLAFFYSVDGLKSAWRGEVAFRQEVVMALILVPLSFLVGQSAIEYVLLFGSVTLVLVVELINSAIEATVDRVGLEKHSLSEAAKDMGSAAVLVSLVLAFFVWMAIFLS
jgi:diacylglycerol kinase (ATP)